MSDLPDHPLLTPFRKFGTSLYYGLPEVIAMQQINPTPAELRAKWSPGPMPIEYDNGIDYEPPARTETDGLEVVEFKRED